MAAELTGLASYPGADEEAAEGAICAFPGSFNLKSTVSDYHSLSMTVKVGFELTQKMTAESLTCRVSAKAPRGRRRGGRALPSCRRPGRVVASPEPLVHPAARTTDKTEIQQRTRLRRKGCGRGVMNASTGIAGRPSRQEVSQCLSQSSPCHEGRD
ncbi:hypothetical protein [Streptomyces sp. NPDC051286]|uniref:hypothetical protein n=1 Tax=Streptomyces sp. NPDC051286 TaxID=3365647 RepID=UPI00378A299E